MRHRLHSILVLGALAAITAYPGASLAETAVPLQSCDDGVAEYQACLNWFAFMGPGDCTQLASQCWDFEHGLAGGAFGAWDTSAAGMAFSDQPTYGDNVAAGRVLQTQASPLHPQSGSLLDDLNAIGGDYWQTPYPIGHQGNYWIGSYEGRSSPAVQWGAPNGTGGDWATGTISSPSFVVNRDLITFLIGGGCDINLLSVAVQVLTMNKYKGWVWTQATDMSASRVPLKATGSCSELMERKVFRTDRASGLQGKTVRIVITDNATGPWGHINVDHILHTNRPPTDLGGANRPLWGFADTHAHPGNHESFQALSSSGGHLMHGTPEDLTPCDGWRHGVTNHTAGIQALSGMETASLGMTSRMPAGCSTGTDLLGFIQVGSGCKYYEHKPQFKTALEGGHLSGAQGTPYWYSRAHQQMHVDWMKRAWQGGQRLMIATAGNNEVIGQVLRFGHLDKFVSDYGAMRRFAVYMNGLARNALYSNWMEIALTPADARRIIRANKLAIVLATEVDDIGDNCLKDLSAVDDGGETTTMSGGGANPWNMVKAKTSCGQNDALWKTRVANLYRVGYRMIIPMHFANNDLGGPAVYTDAHNTVTRFVSHDFLNMSLSLNVGFRLGEPLRKWAAANGWNQDDAASRTEELGWCNFSLFGGCAAGGGQGGVNALGLVAAPIVTPLVSVVSPILLATVPALILDVSKQATYTPIPIGATNGLPPYTPGIGHINAKGLTNQGRTVLQAMMDRGMIIDMAHMGEFGRREVLGFGAPGANAGQSMLSPGCDISNASCQTAAYPVISSHAGLRELSPIYPNHDERNEGGLTAAMVERIRAIGGTVAVGTAGGDSNDAYTATGGTNPWTGQPWTGIFSQAVANDCAGSSKTFAQGYLYVLRRMAGRGVTLGTDINGLEAQLNPRFGSMGCYARGNIPRIFQGTQTTTLIDENHVPAINGALGVPFNYNPDNLQLYGAAGTAGGQRWQQRLSNVPGLNYTHYNGVPPSGGNNQHYVEIRDPDASPLTNLRYDQSMLNGNADWHYFDLSHQPNETTWTSTSMMALASAPPLRASEYPAGYGSRTFDFNYDGLAQYGMLPDMLQDTRANGMTLEQLGPLFQGAEHLIEAWEKSCSLSNPMVNGCGPPRGFSSLGGAFTSGPGAASWGSNRLDIFGRGTDNRLYWRQWNGSTWGYGWSQVAPEQIDSDPAAVSWGPNRIDVFARGTDGAIWTLSWTGSAWTSWTSLGGQFTSAPAVASWGAGRLDVFGRGTDNALWARSWDGSSWGNGWTQLTTQEISSDPAAVSWGANRIDVFALGTDNQMYAISWNGAGWNTWSPLGGQFTSGPAVASWAAGRLDVFARGNDYKLYAKSWNGTSWNDWSLIAPMGLGSKPAAVSWGANRIDVFAKGTDNQMYAVSWDGTSW